MGHSHSPYLEDIPLSAALERWWSALADAALDGPLPGETVALAEANGRITAEPVWAAVSSPHYHASAMDGYAVHVGSNARRQRDASPAPAHRRRRVLRRHGRPAAARRECGHHDRRRAGARGTRRGADRDPGGRRALAARAADGRGHGGDGVDPARQPPATPAGYRRGGWLGTRARSARRQPRVAILPTGTELVAPGAALRPGDIIEYNSLVLGALVREWGGEVTSLPPLTRRLRGHSGRDRLRLRKPTTW